jgi:hypothetical protein
MNQDEPLLKPYSLKELSVMYGVSKNTFKKWMDPFSHKLGQRQGYYYSIEQVKMIFNKLGVPGLIYKKRKKRG